MQRPRPGCPRSAGAALALRSNGRPDEADGPPWSEQPACFQALFVRDRIQAMAPPHPEWKTRERFASVLKGTRRTVFVPAK
jgi:hypothetical protein